VTQEEQDTGEVTPRLLSHFILAGLLRNAGLFRIGMLAAFPSERWPFSSEIRTRTLSAHGQKLRKGDAIDLKLHELRQMYEPYVYSLATYFQVILPPWIAEEGWNDNWQGSFWKQIEKGTPSTEKNTAKHF